MFAAGPPSRVERCDGEPNFSPSDCSPERQRNPNGQVLPRSAQGRFGKMVRQADPRLASGPVPLFFSRPRKVISQVHILWRGRQLHVGVLDGVICGRRR